MVSDCVIRDRWGVSHEERADRAWVPACDPGRHLLKEEGPVAREASTVKLMDFEHPVTCVLCLAVRFARRPRRGREGL